MAQGNNRDLFAALCYHGQQQGHDVKKFMLGLLDSKYKGRLETNDSMGGSHTVAEAYKTIMETEPDFVKDFCSPYTKLYKKDEIYFIGKLLYTFWIHRKISGKALYELIGGNELDYMFNHWHILNEVGLSRSCDMILNMARK